MFFMQQQEQQTTSTEGYRENPHLTVVSEDEFSEDDSFPHHKATQQQSSLEEEDSFTLELIPPLANDPFAHFGRFLDLQCCAPPHVHNNHSHSPFNEDEDENAPRMRSATVDSETSSSASSSHFDPNNSSNPLQHNLQRARDFLGQTVQNVQGAVTGFVTHVMEEEIPKFLNKQEDNDNDKEEAPKKRTSKSVVSFDLEPQSAASSSSTENVVYETTTTTTTHVLIITQPGTSRAVRIYRGLEMVVVLVIILYATLYGLQRLGNGTSVHWAVEAKYAPTWHQPAMFLS